MASAEAGKQQGMTRIEVRRDVKERQRLLGPERKESVC
jgi:hypothetical protein